jgi:hypothetical protein
MAEMRPRVYLKSLNRTFLTYKMLESPKRTYMWGVDRSIKLMIDRSMGATCID